MLSTNAVLRLIHKVDRMGLKAAGASFYMKIVEFKCFASSNVLLYDLSPTFKERLLSSSNTDEFFHCVGIAGEHYIQSQLQTQSSHLCTV